MATKNGQQQTAPRPRKWEKAFLAILAESGNVTKACLAAQIARSVVYAHRDEDERFKALWDEALAEAGDALELEARRRAVDGWDEPVFQKGELVGTIRKYSDTLLLAMLRAKKPEYREKVLNEHTGKDGGPIDWRQVVEQARRSNEEVDHAGNG